MNARACVSPALLLAAFSCACAGVRPPAPLPGSERVIVRDERGPAIEIDGLPKSGRVVRRVGWKTELLVQGDQSRALYLPYRLATASDGVRHFEHPVTRQVLLEARAFGYLPKSIAVSVPGARRIDAHLQPVVITGPACEPGTRLTSSPETEAAFELSLMKRDEDALPALRDELERTKQAELWVDIGQVLARLGDRAGARRAYESFIAACPRSLGLSEVGELAAQVDGSSAQSPPAILEGNELPMDAAARLSLTLGRIGRRQAALVDRVIGRARAGAVRDAQRLAQAAAGRLEPGLASDLLRLPTLLLVARCLEQASIALAENKSSRALELLGAARAIAPALVDRSGLSQRALEQRATQLAARTRSLLLSDPLLAAAYFMAWRAVLERDVAVPDALDSALKQAANSSFVIHDGTDRDWPAGAHFHRTLLQTLKGKLPENVALADAGEAAEWELALTLGAPQRTFEGSVKTRTKTVLAYTYSKANPAWADAAADYNSAIENCGSARDSYRTLHQAAQEMAQKVDGSAAGLFAGIASGGEEATAIAVVASSQARLRNASRTLKETPQRTRVQVQGDVHYPVRVFATHVKSVLSWRLAGPEQNLEDQALLTADREAELVEAMPEIDVAARDTGVEALKSLELDYDTAAIKLAERVARVLTEAEDARLWADVESAKKTGTDAERAVAYAVYYSAGKQSERRDEALNYLRWRLQ